MAFTGEPFADLSPATDNLDRYLEYLHEVMLGNQRIVKEVVKLTGSNRTDECIAKLRSYTDMEAQSARLEAELIMVQGQLNKNQQELAGL